MNKNRSTQELVGIFPEWSKVRSDDQSVGFSFLNVFGKQLDKMDEYLERMRRNQYLSTVNLNEIHQTYRIDLPKDFEFQLTQLSEIEQFNSAPTVTAFSFLDYEQTLSGYIDVQLATDNDIESFWYTSVPTRTYIDDVIYSGTNDLLLDYGSEDFPYDAELAGQSLFHHLSDGGYLTIEVVSGVQFITVNEQNNVDRATIIIEGITRKGTEETETLIFPWNLKQQTFKEWKEIKKISGFGFDDTARAIIKSSDFTANDYLSFWNLRYSPFRTKVDEFWKLDNENGYCTLNRTGFVSDKWQDLILGLNEKETKRKWELLDSGYNNINLVDITIEPFTNRAWGVTSNGELYCYTLDESYYSGLNLLVGSTSECDIDLDFDNRYITLGEDITFIPWHSRPLQEIDRYRIWYQTPGGVKYGLLNNVQVAFSSDFYVYNPTIKRNIESLVSVTADERGEYLFCIEVDFIDGSQQTKKVLAKVDYKLPIAHFSIGSPLNSGIVGIDFDSDQRLWIKKQSAEIEYYRLRLLTDVFLVDFDQKMIFLKEDYINVEVEP